MKFGTIERKKKKKNKKLTFTADGRFDSGPDWLALDRIVTSGEVLCQL